MWFILLVHLESVKDNFVTNMNKPTLTIAIIRYPIIDLMWFNDLQCII